MDLDLTTALSSLRGMLETFLAALPKLALAVLALLAFAALARGMKSLTMKATTGRDANVSLLLARLARWTTLIFGVLVALMIVAPGFEVGELVSILGIGGVAIGFAFRDILQNFLAGILILLTRPFQVGDQIRVNDYEGTVEEIETRATTIKTYDNRRVVIPNGDLFTDSVTVNTAFSTRRSQYDVGIGYEDDIGRAKSIMLEAMRGVEGVLDEPAPQALTVDLAGSSVNIRARWWTKSDQASVITIQDKVITDIKEALVDAGINIPFPIRTVYFNDETGYFDRDKDNQNGESVESAASLPADTSGVTGSKREPS